jgi:gliding motility-associated-like protein
MVAKKITLFIGICLFPFSLFSQGWTVSSVIKCKDDLEPKFSVIDNSGNIYILSSFKDSIYQPALFSRGNTDLLLLKINPSGNLLWYKQIGGTGLDNAGGLQLVNNELVVLINFMAKIKFSPTDSVVSKGNLDVAMARFTTDGNYVFSKLIGTSPAINDPQVILGSAVYNNHLVVSGNFNNQLLLGVYPSTDTLIGNAFNTNYIAELDLSGNVIWSKKILSSTSNCKINKVALSENGFYFGGFYRGIMYFDVGNITSNTAGFNDVFLYKTDFTGTGSWIRKIFGAETENIKTITTDEYDNIYILGNYHSNTLYVDSTSTVFKTYNDNVGGFDTYIGKFNRSGILQWLIRKGSTARDIYNDFVVRNNVIFATGYFTDRMIFGKDTLKTISLSVPNANPDAFIAAFNQVGEPISGVSIVGTGDIEDAGTIVNMDANSRAYVSGYYISQQIKIGSQTYTSSNVGKKDQFFAIYQQPLSLAFTKKSKVTCNGMSDGMLQVTPYFGKPPYTYSWSHDPANNSYTASNLPAGKYTVTVTDANNSSAQLSETIIQPDPITILGTITPVTCNNLSTGAIDITVSGGTKKTDYTYDWTTITGSGVSPHNQDQTGLTDGTYYVTVRDDNSCASSSSFTVTEPAPIRFSGSIVTNIQVPTVQGAIDLHPSGGNTPYTIAWTGPNGFSAATEDLSNLTDAGIYSASVTDSKNCLADTGMLVNDGTTMTASVTSITPVLCYGDDNGTVEITVNYGLPPYNFQWSDGLNTGLNTRTNMAPGDYSVLVTDAATPVAHSTQFNLHMPGPSAALNLVALPKDLGCFRDTSGTINLVVTGGTNPYRYDWSNGYKGEDLVSIPAGIYSVTVTDTNGCSAVRSDIEVDEPAGLSLTINETSTIKCHGDRTSSLTCNVTGGSGTYSYLWDDPGTQVTQTAVQLSAGNYKVTVTDLNDCSLSETKLVSQPDSMWMDITVNAPSCTGDGNGALVPAMHGGTPSFSFVWSNNVYTQNNTDLVAGTYSVMVTDANNCSKADTFSLSDPLPVVINGVDSTNVSCFGLADGFVRIDASGGTGSLHYSANNGQDFSDNLEIGSLPAGDHIILVKDDNDCIAPSYMVTITQPDSFAVDTTEVIYIDAQHPTGTIRLSSIGGNSPVYFYIVPDGSSNTSGEFTELAADDYKVYAQDASNCKSNELAVSIPEPNTSLIVYDAFSPNADGINDVWNIHNIDYYPNCTVKIYNTWGVAVFSSKGYGVPWDGKYKGNDLPSGTYYYTIDPGDGSDVLSGPVNIVK